MGQKIQKFLDQHSVFHRSELESFLLTHGSTNKSTLKSFLNYNIRKGKLSLIKKNLYGVIPKGITSDKWSFPGDLVAAKATSDSVLAYHTALEAHALYYSIFFKKQFFTHSYKKSFITKFHIIQPYFFPQALIHKKQELTETEITKICNVDVRVPTVERTVVDAFYNIPAAGGWEEIFRGLECLTAINQTALTKYALLLENASLIGILGFYLESNKERLEIDRYTLKKLDRYKPKYPQLVYGASKHESKLVSKWNIILPKEVIGEHWEEPNFYGDIAV